MSFDETESRAQILERLASEISAGKEFEDFVIQNLSPNVTDLEAVACYLRFKAQCERQPRRRKRGERPQARVLPPESTEAPKWPADPVWGEDERGRFSYRDYDGEALVIYSTGEGGIWVDKSGQGPVLVLPEHVDLIGTQMKLKA